MGSENLERAKTSANNAWCPVPWISLGVRSTGDVRYCCHANGSAGKGLLKNSAGESLNLATHAMSDGKNAPILKDVRKVMLEGKQPEGCARCYREEKAGMYSRRHSEIFIWEPSITEEQARSSTAPDGSITEEDVPLRYLDLRFGNKCNLRCRMCGPTESDQWYDTYSKIWKANTFRDGENEFEIFQDEAGEFKIKSDPYNWHDNADFWSGLDRYLPKMERLYFAGGEPLLIQRHFDLLTKCIEMGVAQNITLEYNSNITALNETILGIWSAFKFVEIGMSLDGVGEINEYIRHPSKWSQVQKKIKLLDEAKGNLSVWWAATIQIYNMLHLPDMMSWIIAQDFNRINRIPGGKSICAPHPLSNPNFLSVKVFPERSKAYIKQLFAEKKTLAAEQIMDSPHFDAAEKTDLVFRYDSILDSYVEYMMAEDLSHLMPKFWRYTNRMDEHYGTSLHSVCPRTFELML